MKHYKLFPTLKYNKESRVHSVETSTRTNSECPPHYDSCIHPQPLWTQAHPRETAGDDEKRTSGSEACLGKSMSVQGALLCSPLPLSRVQTGMEFEKEKQLKYH